MNLFNHIGLDVHFVFEHLAYNPHISGNMLQ